jgi:hypothetical protein
VTARVQPRPPGLSKASEAGKHDCTTAPHRAAVSESEAASGAVGGPGQIAPSPARVKARSDLSDDFTTEASSEVRSVGSVMAPCPPH